MEHNDRDVDVLARTPMSQPDLVRSLLAAMARFVHKHTAAPLKELRESHNEQRAEILELRRRISALESK